MKKHLTILTNPNPSLKKRSVEIDEKTLQEPEVKELIKNMVYTMHKDKGVGLAAPQIGKNIRLIAINKDALKETKEPLPFSKRKSLVIINPTFVPLNTEKEVGVEGCLSVPEIWGNVERHKKIHVCLTTPDGKQHKFIATDFLARVLQHEIDHLDGVLFTDRAIKTWETE